MARTGRPQSKNPLKYDIKVRLDEETFQKLNAACEESGTERATFIREAVRSQLGAEGAGLPEGAAKRLGPPQKSPVIKGGKDGVTRLVGEAKDAAPAAKRPDAAGIARDDAAETPAQKAKKGAPVNKKIDVFLH